MLQSLSLDNPRLVQQSLSWYVRACVKAIHGTCRERVRNHVALSLPMFSQAQLLIQIDAYAHSTTRMDKKGNQHHTRSRCVGRAKLPHGWYHHATTLNACQNLRIHVRCFVQPSFWYCRVLHWRVATSRPFPFFEKVHVHAAFHDRAPLWRRPGVHGYHANVANQQHLFTMIYTLMGFLG